MMSRRDGGSGVRSIQSSKGKKKFINTDFLEHTFKCILKCSLQPSRSHISGSHDATTKELCISTYKDILTHPVLLPPSFFPSFVPSFPTQATISKVLL